MRSMTLFFTVMVVCITTFAQTDSVYVSIKKKIFREFQFVYPNGENSLCENYVSMKGTYLFNKTDTLPLSEVFRQNNEAIEKGKKPVFILYGGCDSLINIIKNTEFYSRKTHEVNKFQYQKIGDNREIKRYRQEREASYLKFSEQAAKCHGDFATEVEHYLVDLKFEISNIKKNKEERLLLLKSDPSTISQKEIVSFVLSFDACKEDFESAELIILNNPEEFMQAMIYGLNSTDFGRFTSELSKIPKEAKIAEMLSAMQRVESKSPRKKYLINALKSASKRKR